MSRLQLRKGKASFKRLRPLLFVAALCVLGLGGWLTFDAFRTPLQAVEETTDLQVELDTHLDHLITPVQSLLYPEPTQLVNEPFFYTRLLDAIVLDLKASLQANPAARFTGTAGVELRVVAPERWERSFVLREMQPFQSTGAVDELTVFDEPLPLPLEEMQSFIAQVEEETRIMPRSDYQLLIVPVIEFTATAESPAGDGEGSAATVEETFETSYAFRLAGQTLVADTPPDQRRDAATTRLVRSPGVVSLGSLTLPVGTARIIGPAVFAVAGALLVVLLLARSAQLAALPEAEQIRRRYRSRLMELRADSRSPLGNGNTVLLASFQDLVRIADEREQGIFVVADGPVHHYLVLDGNLCYAYVAAATSATDVGDASFAAGIAPVVSGGLGPTPGSGTQAGRG